MEEFDVIIIGGGITGAGTARDCALRGLNVLLVERDDIATGATGRNHGLLHSGARYAVTDKESASECIKENMILKKVARHCVDDTSGLFITLPEDDLSYQETFVKSCLEAGIKAEVIDPKEALRLEPSVNPSLTGAVKVPDGCVDPFRLCSANIVDAITEHGDALDADAKGEAAPFFRVIAAGLKDLRVDHAGAKDLNPTGALAGLASFAATGEARDINLNAWLGEWEVRRTETNLPLLAEHLLREEFKGGL